MSELLRVGIIGCGEASQALHIPALNSLASQFRITAVNDACADVAEEVAGRTGARACSSMQELLEDDDVDVVLITTPDSYHHECVIAACEAKKRAVMVEKPLTINPRLAGEIVKAFESNNVPVIVAYPHVYDPVVQRAMQAWGKPDKFKYGEFHIIIGPNYKYTIDALQTIRTKTPDPFGGIMGQLDYAAATTEACGTDLHVNHVLTHAMLLGITIHDIPVIRRFLGDPQRVEYANFRFMGMPLVETEVGIDVILDYGVGRVFMQTEIQTMKMTDWHFKLRRDDLHMQVRYPSTYSGSTPSEMTLIREQDGMTVKETHSGKYMNGFRCEWQHLYDVAVNGEDPLTSVNDAVKDLELVEAIMQAGIENYQGGTK